MTDFEKIIQFMPAFDKRSPDPKRNYGVGAMKILFILKGELGATQFVFSTGCLLKHVQDEFWNNCHDRKYNPFEWNGFDIGYHSPKPMYEGQTEMDCDLIDGGKCYYDGTSLGASEFAPEFVAKGEDAVWKKLKEVYEDRFLDTEKLHSSEEQKETDE